MIYYIFKYKISINQKKVTLPFCIADRQLISLATIFTAGSKYENFPEVISCWSTELFITVYQFVYHSDIRKKSIRIAILNMVSTYIYNFCLHIIYEILTEARTKPPT